MAGDHDDDDLDPSKLGPNGEDNSDNESDAVHIPEDEYAGSTFDPDADPEYAGSGASTSEEVITQPKQGGFLPPTDPGKSTGPKTPRGRSKTSGNSKLPIGIAASLVVVVAGALAYTQPWNTGKPPIPVKDPNLGQNLVQNTGTNPSLGTEAKKPEVLDIETPVQTVVAENKSLTLPAEITTTFIFDSVEKIDDLPKLDAFEALVKERQSQTTDETKKSELDIFLRKLQDRRVELAPANPAARIDAPGIKILAVRHPESELLQTDENHRLGMVPHEPVIRIPGGFIVSSNWASLVLSQGAVDIPPLPVAEMKTALPELDPKLFPEFLNANLSSELRVDSGIRIAKKLLEKGELTYSALVCRDCLKLLGSRVPADEASQRRRAILAIDLNRIMTAIEIRLDEKAKALAASSKTVTDELVKVNTRVDVVDAKADGIDTKVTNQLETSRLAVLDTFWQAIAAEFQQEATQELAENARITSRDTSKQVSKVSRQSLFQLDTIQKQLSKRIARIIELRSKSNPPNNPPVDDQLTKWKSDLDAISERLKVQISAAQKQVGDTPEGEPAVVPPTAEELKLSEDAAKKLDIDVTLIVDIMINLSEHEGHLQSGTPGVNVLAEILKQINENPAERGALAKWLLGNEVLDPVGNNTVPPAEADAKVIDGLFKRWLTQQVKSKDGMLGFLAKVKSIPVDENGVALGARTEKTPPAGPGATQADFDKWLQAYIAKNKNVDPRDCLTQAAWLKNQTTRPGIIYSWLERVILDLSRPEQQQGELTKLLNIQLSNIVKAHRVHPNGILFDLNNLPPRVTGLEKLPPRVAGLEKLPPRITELEKLPPQLKKLGDSVDSTGKELAEVTTRVKKLEVDVATPRPIPPHVHPQYEADIKLMGEKFAALEMKLEGHVKDHPPATMDTVTPAEVMEWLKKNGYPQMPAPNVVPIPVEVEIEGAVGSAHECFSRGCEAYFSKSPFVDHDALMQLARAVQLQPEDPMYRYFYGLILRKTGRIVEAEQQVRYGAQLERKKGPAADYFVRLERVQYEPRQWLDQVRRTVLPGAR